MKKSFSLLLIVPLLFTGCSSSKEPNARLVYKTQAKNMVKLMKNIPTVQSIIKGKKKTNNVKEVVNLDASSDDTYDYTVYAQPKTALAALGLCYGSGIDGLFSLDDRLEGASSNNEQILNKYAQQYNSWEKYFAEKYCRVNYNPAFNTLKLEVKEYWLEEDRQVDCTYNYSIGKNKDDKIFFRFQTFYRSPYEDQGKHAYGFEEIDYLEDNYFIDMRTNYIEGNSLPSDLSYSELNFQEKLYRSYRETFPPQNSYDKLLEYQEMPYDQDIMPLTEVQIFSDGNMVQNGVMIYGKDYVPLYDGIDSAVSLYAFDGIESITSTREIIPDGDGQRNPYLRNMPLKVTSQNGTSFEGNNIVPFEFGSIAYENYFDGINIIAPCININRTYSFDLDTYYQMFDMLKNNYNLTLKDNIKAVFDNWKENNVLTEERKAEVNAKVNEFKEKAYSLYQPVGEDMWNYVLSTDNQTPIIPGQSLELLSLDITGDVKYNEGKLDLSSLSLEIGAMDEFVEEDYYVDYYLYNDLNRYIIGSEKIAYEGKSATINLTSNIELNKNYYHQGQYNLVAVLRNRGNSMSILKSQSLTKETSSYFEYETNEDKEILVSISYPLN